MNQRSFFSIITKLLFVMLLLTACGIPEGVTQPTPPLIATSNVGQVAATNTPAPTDPADPLGLKTAVIQTDTAAAQTALAGTPAPTKPAPTAVPTLWPPRTPVLGDATAVAGGGFIIVDRGIMPQSRFVIENSWTVQRTIDTMFKINAGGYSPADGQTGYGQGGIFVAITRIGMYGTEPITSTYYATPTKSGKAKVIDASVTSSLTKVRIQTENGSTWWFDVTNRQWLSSTSTPVPTTPPTTQPTPTGQSVQSLTLINADTDQPIAGYDPLVNGATLNFAMLPTRNLNIRANTNPATVGSVKFVLDGATYQIENSAPYALAGNNGNDYNPWTPSVGSHTLQAIPYSASGATGTQGAGITISFSVVDGGTPMPTATPKTALFVVSNANSLNAGDTAVKTRLEGLGYTVTLKTATASATSDATGKTLVLISSSVASGDVNTKFKSVTVPVITWEYALYDDMAMTNTTSGMDYGYNTGTSMVITSANHPLAGGLSGTVNLYNTSTNIPFGVPSANAINVGAVSSTSTRKLEFAYDKNAAMVGGFTVNARRVGLFLVDTATPTTDAWTLFDAAVNWSTAP